MAPTTATITENPTTHVSVTGTGTGETQESSWSEDVHFLGDKEGKVKLR
jgi:hypothetical protein